MDQNWFYLIEQASDISKIIFSFIIYACCLNKTTKTINKLTNEQPRSHFFLTDPLLPRPSISLMFNYSKCLSFHLSVRPSVHESVRLPMCSSVRLSILQTFFCCLCYSFSLFFSSYSFFKMRPRIYLRGSVHPCLRKSVPPLSLGKQARARK